MTDTRIKPKKTMLDTNIYGWALAYVAGDRRESAINSYNLIDKLFEERRKREPLYSVLSCQRIIEEVEESKKTDVQTLHNSLCDEIVYRSKHIEDLSEKYFDEFDSRKLPITIEDCEIVSSATLGRSAFLVTENRKTLSNPRAIDIYNRVNKKNGLSSPQIVTSTEALIKMFSF